MVRLALGLTVLMVLSGCNCARNACDGVRCASGAECSNETGRCVFDAGSLSNTNGDGGSDAGAVAQGQCTPECSSTTPICDPATNSCKTCTETTGCGGLTPVCNTIGNGGFGVCVTCTVAHGCPASLPFCDPTVQPSGACFECLRPADCVMPGTTCETTTHTCVTFDAGGNGGTGGGGGIDIGTAEFDDAGLTARCLPYDAGAPECISECSRGYVCINHQCVLRGSTGPVQVTLRWPHDEDLDLHLVEPKPNGQTCEIWYSASNAPPSIPLPFPLPPGPFDCGATGWLDLDSNAACGTKTDPPMLDHKRVENIIYPPTKAPPKGTYTVRVDYYQNCTGLPPPEPFEVEVRANGVTRYYCGLAHTPDQGTLGSGQTVTTFTIR